jgi:hypothetical protein
VEYKASKAFRLTKEACLILKREKKRRGPGTTQTQLVEEAIRLLESK